MLGWDVMVMRILANILLILVLAAVLGGGAWYYSSQLTPEYQSGASLLFIQEQRPSLDPATTIRSAERIVEMFAQVVMTEDFLNQVILLEPSLSDSLPESLSDRREQWQSMMSAQTDGSFLQLNIFYKDAKVAEKTVSAAAVVLMTKTNEWHGGGETVQVKIVDTPLTSDQPVRPNILLNTILGAITGFLLAVALLLYQYYFPNKKARALPVKSNKIGINNKASLNSQKQQSEKVNFLEANHMYSDYMERVFVDKTGLYEPQAEDEKFGANQQVKLNLMKTLPWNMSIGSPRQTAPILSQRYNEEPKHYI